jgi:hypothetical protein
MCFGKKPKAVKAPPIPQVQVQQPTPFQQQQPQTESGADNQPKKKGNKSIFQVDLTIPTTGLNTGAQGSFPSSQGTGAGPIIR